MISKFNQPIDVVLIFGLMVVVSLYLSLRFCNMYHTYHLIFFLLMSIFFMVLSAISLIITINTVEEIKNDKK